MKPCSAPLSNKLYKCVHILITVNSVEVRIPNVQAVSFDLLDFSSVSPLSLSKIVSATIC